MRGRAKTNPQIAQMTQMSEERRDERTYHPGALNGKRKFCLTGGNEK